jgi:hypothetical protein
MKNVLNIYPFKIMKTIKYLIENLMWKEGCINWGIIYICISLFSGKHLSEWGHLLTFTIGTLLLMAWLVLMMFEELNKKHLEYYSITTRITKQLSIQLSSKAPGTEIRITNTLDVPMTVFPPNGQSFIIKEDNHGVYVSGLDYWDEWIEAKMREYPEAATTAHHPNDPRFSETQKRDYETPEEELERQTRNFWAGKPND